MAGRSLKETMQASGASTLVKTLIKATDSSLEEPKRKHVESLLMFTHRPEIATRDVVEGLFKRLEEPGWVVVLKTLLVFHRLMRDGHEKFYHALATRPTTFEDVMGYKPSSKSAEAAAMTELIRRYARYLHQKVLAYRQNTFDVTHVKGSEQVEVLKTVAPPELYKSLGLLQDLLNHLLVAVDLSDGSTGSPTQAGLTTAQLASNKVAQCATNYLRKDCLKMFVCLNDGIVNMLERFFTMPKKEASDGLAVYELFVQQCSYIDVFMAACKHVGVIAAEAVPDLSQAPMALLPKMREYVLNYGASKGMPAEFIDRATAPGISAVTHSEQEARETEYSAAFSAAQDPDVMIRLAHEMEFEEEASEA
eukprot:m.38103 g.38103  ORF g.38103 m.38103 type:complete len:364 (+) comp11151_c0_seq3:151-1242(+)